MTTLDDDLLLDSLGAALDVDAEPSAGEVAVLRALVTTTSRRRVVALPVSPTARRPAHHVLRAAAVVGAIVMACGALAVTQGSRVSPALRPAARALGFPVDASSLDAANAAMSSLRDLLAHGDEASIVRASAHLVDRLHALTPTELDTVRAEALALLATAAARLEPPPVAVPVEDVSTETSGHEGAAPTVTQVAESDGTQQAAAAGPEPAPGGQPAVVAPTPVVPPVAHEAEEGEDSHESEDPEAEEPESHIED